MKKILCSILCFAFLVCVYSNNANALETMENSYTYIEYLENGDYLKTTIIEENPSLYVRANGTKSGTKKVSYMNGNTTLWTVSVSGKFTYTGSSASCTSATVSTTCPSSSWKISNKSSSRSANNAFAKATGKNYLLGVCIQTVDRTVKLSCSSSGKLS